MPTSDLICLIFNEYRPHWGRWINDERMDLHCLTQVGMCWVVKYTSPSTSRFSSALEMSLGLCFPNISWSLRNLWVLGEWGFTIQYIPPLGSVWIGNIKKLNKRHLSLLRMMNRHLRLWQNVKLPSLAGLNERRASWCD